MIQKAACTYQRLAKIHTCTHQFPHLHTLRFECVCPLVPLLFAYVAQRFYQRFLENKLLSSKEEIK